MVLDLGSMMQAQAESLKLQLQYWLAGKQTNYCPVVLSTRYYGDEVCSTRIVDSFLYQCDPRLFELRVRVPLICFRDLTEIHTPRATSTYS